MIQTYNADAIEVLTGPEPACRCPGMYTDTTRPSHLGQKVIDNSIDGALTGHVERVGVILRADQSLKVIDDGRGMLAGIHPEEGVPTVGLILCRPHTDGKFSNKNYQLSGGLHGVGTSMVSALSKRVEVNVRRGGQVYNTAFENGEKVQDLQAVDTCDKRDTGTSVHFWPDETFFDSPRFSVSRLTHVLKAKAVLCSGVETTSKDEIDDTEQRWYYQDGLNDHLAEAVNDLPALSERPFIGNFAGDTGAVDWVLLWLSGGGELLTESYANLIPTMQGGTHVNGLCQGLLGAIRGFYECRNILPRGVKLLTEDIWDRYAYVLLMKMQDPQFAGQTKERLSSRRCAALVPGAVRDAFILWLNQSVQTAEPPAETMISSTRRHICTTRKVVCKKLTSDPALPGKLADRTMQDFDRTELFLVEGGFADGSAKQAHDREYQAIMPLKGKILNTWKASSDEVLASQEVHGISIAVSVDPDSDDLSQFRYGKIYIPADTDSDGLHVATLLCVLFVRHFRALVEHGHIYVILLPLYRIDLGKRIYYALTEEEKEGVPEQLERKKGKPNVQCFKGLGEMSPMQLHETMFDPSTRRLVQLTTDDEDDQHTDAIMDMLLAKKRSEDRRSWLQERGDAAGVEV